MLVEFRAICKEANLERFSRLMKAQRAVLVKNIYCRDSVLLLLYCNRI